VRVRATGRSPDRLRLREAHGQAGADSCRPLVPAPALAPEQWNLWTRAPVASATEEEGRPAPLPFPHSTTNTLLGPTAVPTTGHLLDVTVAGAVATLHDSALVTASAQQGYQSLANLGQNANSQALTAGSTYDPVGTCVGFYQNPMPVLEGNVLREGSVLGRGRTRDATASGKVNLGQ
jgi:hypothetical protein